MLTMAPTAMAWPTMGMAMVLPTTPMPTTDTTARGLLMLMLLPLLMLTMVPMAMVLPTMDMDTVLPTMDMDTTDMLIPMPTTDTMARGLLMLPLLLMLTMVP